MEGAAPFDAPPDRLMSGRTPSSYLGCSTTSRWILWWEPGDDATAPVAVLAKAAASSPRTAVVAVTAGRIFMGGLLGRVTGQRAVALAGQAELSRSCRRPAKKREAEPDDVHISQQEARARRQIPDGRRSRPGDLVLDPADRRTSTRCRFRRQLAACRPAQRGDEILD